MIILTRINRLLFLATCILLFSCNKQEKIDYYPDGKIKSKTSYKNEIKNGPFYTYFKSGKVETIGNYIDGKKEGDFTFYYDNGNIYAKIQYRNDKQNGTYSEFYEDKSIKVISHFLNDSVNGESQFFYPSGRIRTISESKEGDIQFYKSYSETGKLDTLVRNIDFFGNYDTIKSGEKLIVKSILRGSMNNSHIDSMVSIFVDYQKLPIFNRIVHHSNVYSYISYPLSPGRYGYNVNYIENGKEGRFVHHQSISFIIAENNASH